ncbi:hypothetical protein ACTFR8_22230 [Bacillus cereus group sp. MYBK15-3]|uniref:hypothetical protein n=1 Tax=Bacillus cereus group TaxID=86661 RepID=UPI001879E3ED|nr:MULTISPECIES: hypothetical protein [Bacillus cereus group]MBE7114636.1 hypothetical protein [Bacillus paranthracis]MBE7154997.1 hypothetical protein [Bacillus paranthracis]MBX9158319.1 hypothetical protein [Bacillus cereus]
MDILGFSEGFRKLTEPVGDKGFRTAFLQNVKMVMAEDVNYKQQTTKGNGIIPTYTDREAVEYVIDNVHDIRIRDAFCESDREEKFDNIQGMVDTISQKEYGIVIGTLLYGLIQVNKIDIEDKRKEIVRAIFRLQGLRD